jgi:elongation factor Ts
MMVITAAMVGKLRAKTSAPMMECKKALTEANGVMDKAEEILRVRLGGKAFSTASRVTSEGVIVSHISGDLGVLLEVNCETDFVTKNDDFLDLANSCARLIVEHNPADVDALSALPLSNNSTVGQVRDMLIGRIGENISIRRFVRFDTNNKLVSYIHGNRIGVMVEYSGVDERVGKDVAMHIAAMKPVSLSSSQVPNILVERERSIATLKAEESGKKPDIIRKMIEGSIQKFIKEVSLLNQSFVKNDKQTVEQMLNAASTSIYSFSIFVVGEGIDKRKDNFAAEVAATVASANQE